MCPTGDITSGGCVEFGQGDSLHYSISICQMFDHTCREKCSGCKQKVIKTAQVSISIKEKNCLFCVEKAGACFSDFILYDIKKNNKKLPNVINYKSLPSPKVRSDCKWRRESKM